MLKIVIIGSGRRVKQDVLPTLNYLGYLKKHISLYATQKKSILVRDQTYTVLNVGELKKIDENTLVYIAVSKKFTQQILEKVFEINPLSKVIVDTPINKLSIAKKFKKFDISVAEDAYFLGEILVNKNTNLNKFNTLILYKSAMEYHAIAFIEAILSDIYFQISLFKIHFFICSKGIALIIGKKNYEKGKILLNNKTLSFPKLSKNEVELIGGFSNFDNVSYRFLDLKRIGLSQLIKNAVGNKNRKISLFQAYNHYKNSRSI